MRERLEVLTKLYYQVLNPLDCIARVLFHELESGIAKQNPWYKSELREHSSSSEVMCIDYSGKIQLLDICDKNEITHPYFIPGTEYFIRTIFFYDGRRYIRLYCNSDWKSDRKKIDLIDFIEQLHRQDDFAIDKFEKVVFGVI